MLDDGLISRNPPHRKGQTMRMDSRFRRWGAAVAVATAGLGMATPQSASADVGAGNVSISWSIPAAPSSGLTNITFPLTVNPATAHQDGIYFAQQFFFQSNVSGYTGLQPRPNLGGSERLHGVFSLFGSGASTTDPNCNVGADSGPGVSCGVDFDGVYGHQYDLKVARTGTDTWTGTATDTVTGVSTHIGTYTVPAGSGNLRGSLGGFVEYYLGVPSCSTMPRSDAVFGGPTSTDAGGLAGTAQANDEYNGDCLGQANYQAQSVGTGTHVTRGWTTDGAGFTLKSAASGLCADVRAASTDDGTPVQIYACNGTAAQSWTAANGTLQALGKCLDVKAGGTGSGTLVQLYTCNGTGAQQWQQQADGSLTNPQSGKCLDDPNASTVPGTQLQIWDCWGGANQKWTHG